MKKYHIYIVFIFTCVISCSNDQSYNPLVKRLVSDIDGNIYETVKIGDQWWMAENLKVTHYRNGDELLNIKNYIDWYGLNTGAYCNYNNDEDNVVIYGHLYNGYAVRDKRNIAPKGWHVPSVEEWQTLIDSLGGELIAGGKMKEFNLSLWDNPNIGATNESGFSGLPGGFRAAERRDMVDHDLGVYGHWYSSTERDAKHQWHYLLFHHSTIIHNSSRNLRYGYSIRCIKD